MILSPIQEEFLRKFFSRQKEIGEKSLEDTSTMAKGNIETILTAGLHSPPTVKKMDELIKKLEEEKEKLKKELDDDEGQI